MYKLPNLKSCIHSSAGNFSISAVGNLEILRLPDLLCKFSKICFVAAKDVLVFPPRLLIPTHRYRAFPLYLTHTGYGIHNILLSPKDFKQIYSKLKITCSHLYICKLFFDSVAIHFDARGATEDQLSDASSNKFPTNLFLLPL